MLPRRVSGALSRQTGADALDFGEGVGSCIYTWLWVRSQTVSLEGFAPLKHKSASPDPSREIF